MKRYGFVALAAALILGAVALSFAFTVEETQRALVVRLGMPLAVHDDPGLYFKVPFIDTVIFFERRLVSLEPPAEQIILGDQKRIEASTYTRFRISDPLAFYQAVGGIEQGQSRLAQIVNSAVRRELGQAKLVDLLSTERDRIIDAIRTQVIERSRSLGVDVVEVRLLRADLPAETSQAIYDRMKSERQREAKELRAQGFEWAQEIQARADRQKTVILAEAQQKAKVTRGEADATASQILGDAYDRSPTFYTFLRTQQTYRQTLAGASPTLLLSPDVDFLGALTRGPSPEPAGGEKPTARAEGISKQ
ncbi:protease modulator HflC [Xanthobacter oligotrophicus]|uniref:protease modulator HflC n=1 Tax=Xanthobacter oligotrophicus TaxID=2607286 RepID=UPI0011F3F089|nr:protease modulator HflC [Xanthobacter oligotrophicus]MCG5238004.1 protease modulator HflC [Xanthobacter oligotrophicus]